jgi:type I restriction enzyme R subunit
MTNPKFTESVVEQATLAWLEGLGYTIFSGPEIAPGEPVAERDNYGQVILKQRLQQALQKINPDVPTDALEEAYRKLIHPDSASPVSNNHTIHKYLVEGVPVEYKRSDGSIGGDLVHVLDFDEPENNDFIAVNQFTVVEDKNERRPDVIIFLNGLPLGVIELKNPADENADIWKAFNQLQTYKMQIPSLFMFNEVLLVSDGTTSRVGTLTADRERFMPWRTIEGEKPADIHLTELQVALEGIFEKRRFLDLIRYFIVFMNVGERDIQKRMAGYHQYHAVNHALSETIKATAQKGDRKVGVVWHTQGSGKSLTMAFYAGRVVLHPAMENPTIVIITDRNDLDDQLFGTFAQCKELIRQEPVQAEDREHLRELLKTSSGGVVFTTIQKYLPIGDELKYPELSDRRNIVVIADEAHRSQYDFIDGFARHMREALPNASFIGFTGTPIELTDKNTRSVFGNYISVYDIERAVKDGATVPIYYESRLAKLDLKESERPKLDEEFEEVTEGEEIERKEKLKTKWAQLEALVGTEKRIHLIAEDIVSHFEERAAAMLKQIGEEGKAMIVCMSRRICIDLYNAIAAIRPKWHHNEDDDSIIKIVMTGAASDPVEWQQHIRSKARREELAERFRDNKDPFKIVIVRDMWLTGFDVPCLHTMYVDKPMRGHGLMQAIARVNRVFKEKPGGLVVDYIGFAHELKAALANYTESGGTGKTTIDQEEAVAVMLREYEICKDFFDGFDFSLWKTGSSKERVSILPGAQEHILKQNDGKNRFVISVSKLSSAFALAVPDEKALEIRDDLSFFQTLKSVLNKAVSEEKRSPDELDYAIRQIVSRAVSSDEVIDIFTAAGLRRPDISILSEKFLEEIRGIPYKNLAMELLRKLLEEEIKTRSKKNVVQARSFREMLENTMRRYQNRAIETAQVIEELLAIARNIRESDQRIEKLGLSEAEIAFYDSLGVNDSAVSVLGDKTLRSIAQELVKAVRSSVTIDWTVRENVRAQIRVMVKRILRRFGYPPDKQEKATELVLEQAAVLCASGLIPLSDL